MEPQDQFNQQMSAGRYAETAAPRPSRRLDAINSSANQAASLAAGLDQLLMRLCGPRPAATLNAANVAQGSAVITVSYANALDRLQDNLSRASKVLEEIEEFA
jgi:hypothetical protein